ncbi:MAG: V-type ATP synthase subunit D [Anaerosomatales bacterium]
MEEVRPTRSELLERREQIKLAEQGMDLLKQKRDALLIEFMGVMDETLRLSESLQKNVAEAQYALAVAKAVDGTVALRSAGMATKSEIVVDMTGTRIMGVSVPVVTKGESPIRSSFTRGYSVTGVSSRVDETADKFERILDVIIEYADIETRLKRLGEEIQKTNRRVNALEQVTVPALREQVSYIRQTLDERARGPLPVEEGQEEDREQEGCSGARVVRRRACRNRFLRRTPTDDT